MSSYTSETANKIREAIARRESLVTQWGERMRDLEMRCSARAGYVHYPPGVQDKLGELNEKCVRVEDEIRDLRRQLAGLV